MMAGMIQKIIDNLQATINNVHIRIENVDYEDKMRTFSLGATLKQMTFHTTDFSWNKQYVDRSAKENSELPLFKLLKIDNFAIYYKIQDTLFLQDLNKDQQSKLDGFDTFFMLNPASGKILIYEKDYLLEPIQLEVKME